MFPDVFDPSFATAPPVDIFSAGFPCQPFSTEGRRLGVSDERAHVIEPILRYMMACLPRAAMLENALGLLQKENIDVAKTIIMVLQKIYHVFTKVLSSKDFGVPHHRERIYIIAIRRDVFTGTFQWPECVACLPLLSFWKRKEQASRRRTRN